MVNKSFGMVVGTNAAAASMDSTLQKLHESLGIPPDYARVSGLQFHPEPDLLVDVGMDVFGRPARLTPAAWQAWQAMQSAAMADQITLQLVSAFRSMAYQADMIARKVAGGRTLEDVLSFNAAPGFSEHHSGRAIDIGTPGCPPLEQEFDQTQAFAWLSAHADKFGFLLSYPKDTVGIIQYEPWHWCFQGANLATDPLRASSSKE